MFTIGNMWPTPSIVLSLYMYLLKSISPLFPVSFGSSLPGRRQSSILKRSHHHCPQFIVLRNVSPTAFVSAPPPPPSTHPNLRRLTSSAPHSACLVIQGSIRSLFLFLLLPSASLQSLPGCCDRPRCSLSRTELFCDAIYGLRRRCFLFSVAHRPSSGAAPSRRFSLSSDGFDVRLSSSPTE